MLAKRSIFLNLTNKFTQIKTSRTYRAVNFQISLVNGKNKGKNIFSKLIKRDNKGKPIKSLYLNKIHKNGILAELHKCKRHSNSLIQISKENLKKLLRLVKANRKLEITSREKRDNLNKKKH